VESRQLWIPGAPGPTEDLVARITRQATALGENVSVTVELAGGATFDLISLSAEPGYGFVTLRPHPEDEPPSEVVVPVGSIAQIRLHAPEEKTGFGFTLPEAGGTEQPPP
jgi:hypothetical protein